MRRDDNAAQPQRDVTRRRPNPNSAWVCGYAELGQGCQSGPTCNGRCGRVTIAGAASNADAQVDNEAEHVASSEMPATAGELPPCIPRRSLWARRRATRLNLAILTGGLLMLCLSLPSREKTFVPGELSARHAQILENTVVSQRCSLCHPNSHGSADDKTADGAMGNLLQSARRLVENDGRQDQLCMQCHQNHLPAAGNRDPHDLSPEAWRKLLEEQDTPWQLVSTRQVVDGQTPANNPASPPGQHPKTSCAMCHTEHHGRGFDIKLISDSRCQACHQKQFESLASGHPEFRGFPIDRPRGLAFSHAKHSQEHFPKKNRDFACQVCHQSSGPASTQDLVTRSVSFEVACASCHDQPIRAATVDGWATLQIPSIEAADTLADAQFTNWPTTARFGYDGVVSPVMRALLMADPAAAAALEKLPANGKIVDISTISASRSTAAKALALATRRLIDDTARDGQSAWVSRLQQVTKQHLERELDDQDQKLIAAMVAGLPPDLFRHVQTTWLNGDVPLAENKQSRPRVPASPASSLVSQSLTQAEPPKSEPQGPKPQGPLQSTPKPQSQTPEPAGQDLLIDESPSNSGKAAGDDLLSDDLLGDGAAGHTGNEVLLESNGDSKKPVSKLVKGATHLTSGGWYADQTTLSIRYMPIGHADPTLAAWSLWWSLLESHRSIASGSDAQRLAQRMALASEADLGADLGAKSGADSVHYPKSQADFVPGKCTECHQLGNARNRLVSTGIGSVAGHFQVIKRDPAAREFTKFLHTPHLTLPALNDCRYCHKEKSQQFETAVSRATDPHAMMSEFASMKLAQCAACHRSGGANDRCVQCHNYHVTSPP